MGAGSGKLRAAAVLFGVALLCGCAAPQQQAVKDKEKKPTPLSVHLPVLETQETDARKTPPGAQPQLQPTDVDDGINRSLNIVEIQFYLGKPTAPQAAGPPDTLGGP